MGLNYDGLLVDISCRHKIREEKVLGLVSVPGSILGRAVHTSDELIYCYD